MIFCINRKSRQFSSRGSSGFLFAFREGDSGHSNRYVFSGKIKCGECSSSFVGRFKYLRSGMKIRRWSCGTATKFGTVACDVGKLIRDDDAMQILKTALRNLPLDVKSIIHHVTALAVEAIQEVEHSTNPDPQRLGFEMERI